MTKSNVQTTVHSDMYMSVILFRTYSKVQNVFLYFCVSSNQMTSEARQSQTAQTEDQNSHSSEKPFPVLAIRQDIPCSHYNPG